MGAEQLLQLQQNLEETKTKLEGVETDPSLIDSLTKHDLVGDILQANVLAFKATNDLFDKLKLTSGRYC